MSASRGPLPKAAPALAWAGALAALAGSAGAQRAERLEEAYSAWVARHEARGGDRDVALALGWSKAYSVRFSSASGVVNLDLIGGSLRVEVSGLDEGGDVWLIDNVPGPGQSAAPDPGDASVFVGSFDVQEGTAVLVAGLPPDLEVDLVAVTRPGTTPDAGGVLFAAPGLWQRRYTEKRGRGRPARLEQLVREGERLFFEETFEGNGRSCGTCHPAANNLTIDPAFIATLPDDDPLFVAEFVPELARDFEKPALMRELGLILENTNGFGDLASDFTMRGAPHTLALPTSLTPAEDFPTEQATGWSGDGAPNGGSLRQFANGAIRQHFPRTTGRVAGVDFRFASDEELDALEAFQLSLGRDRDPDVTPGNRSELVLRSPLAEAGKLLFNDTDSSDGSTGKCARCHNDAGATALGSGTNDNFDTGVESLPDHPADAIVAAVGDPNLADDPPDDGLGSPGDGSFNTPSLVEAADTPPFFHDNAVATLEDAVDFYNSETFAASPSGRFLASESSGETRGIAIHLEAEEVVAVAAFLRALNALESVRSAQEAARSGRPAAALEVAAADAADAAEVLAAGALHPDAEQELRLAEGRLRQAAAQPDARRRLLRDAQRSLESARRRMVVRESRRSR